MGDAGESVVIFAGGGTGGHLYPGLAIAEQLTGPLSGPARVRCMFICSDRPLDAQILSRAGADFAPSCAKPLAMRPRGLVRFLRTWGKAVREARGVIRSQRQASGGRVVVVAMGGFVAAPVTQAAAVEGCPLLLVNLDAVPGKANRFIAWRARGRKAAAGGGVVSAIPVRGDASGAWPVAGPIVRAAARASGSKEECRRRLELEPDRPVLMVTGGSQGARSINLMVGELAKQEAALFREWQVLHQCGKGEREGVEALYQAAGVSRAQVREFSDCMGDWWGAADVAVSRSGAGSVAEAWANRVPTVFLPYPHHRDEHQRWNAEPLATAGAAVIVKDELDAAKNVRAGGSAIVELMRDAGKRGAMRDALTRLGGADGATAIAARVRAMLGAGV